MCLNYAYRHLERYLECKSSFRYQRCLKCLDCVPRCRRCLECLNFFPRCRSPHQRLENPHSLWLRPRVSPGHKGRETHQSAPRKHLHPSRREMWDNNASQVRTQYRILEVAHTQQKEEPPTAKPKNKTKKQKKRKRTKKQKNIYSIVYTWPKFPTVIHT